MSVFSCEYGHTLLQAYWTPRAGKSIDNWKKVIRFLKFPSGKTYSREVLYTTALSNNNDETLRH